MNNEILIKRAFIKLRLSSAIDFQFFDGKNFGFGIVNVAEKRQLHLIARFYIFSNKRTGRRKPDIF